MLATSRRGIDRGATRNESTASTVGRCAQQTRHLAAEAGVTKGTLTGVLKTLEKRGLTRRRTHEADGRLVLVSLEPKGLGLIERLFPAFNKDETLVSASLTVREKNQLASLLRKIIRSVAET